MAVVTARVTITVLDQFAGGVLSADECVAVDASVPFYAELFSSGVLVTDACEPSEPIVGPLFAGLTSRGDTLIEADSDADGVGDLIFRTRRVERARIKSDGTGTGWASVIGGSMPSYVVLVSGSTVSVNARMPGLSSFSGAATDAAAVIQQAVNALTATGGMIVFSQPLTFATQLVIYPNIAFMGSAPFGYAAGPYGPVITSSFNGSCILVTGDSRASTFPYLANFEIVGSHAKASQNGIEFNTSGGNVFDVFVDNIFVDNMGQHGFVLGGSSIKLHGTRCYIELCAGNGIDGSSSSGSDTFELIGCYIEGNTGFGLVGPASANSWQITGGRFSTNAGGAISMPNSTVASIINGVFFDANGDGTHPQILVASANFASARNQINGCIFSTSNNANHIVLAGSNSVQLTVGDCSFYGHSGDAIKWTSRAANQILIDTCMGYTDTRGNITNAFSAAGRIGAAGTAAAPTASTAYKVEGTKLFHSFSGGTGVSATITDPGGNTIASGLTSFTGMLPPQFSINYGAFSVAPTVVTAVA